MRSHCGSCKITVCPMCSRFELGRKLVIQRSTIHHDSKDNLINELVEYTRFLLAENQQLKERIEELELVQSLASLPTSSKGKEPLLEPIARKEDSDSDYEPQSRKPTGIVINMMNEEMVSTQVPDPRRGKRVLNRLYNIELLMEIPGCEKFKVQAILDTGSNSMLHR
ncbi:hypothetical protein LUZ61_008302 [Rhynchospora tenuis]|uniref:Uncharacterized protein n=1 Tax=Rhynchospora tenuis TaxID=198213 RepID=A0AAD5ZV41_9POAL|nr:hypothetical protein LUZ61_008302 [Rhynchospora tenuis]